MTSSMSLSNYPYKITVGPWVGDGWIREGNYVYKHFESAVQYPEAESACAAHVGQSPGNLAAYVLRQPTVIR